VTSTRLVGGLDGCRTGWVLATATATSAGLVVAGTARVRVIATFAEAVRLVLDGTLAALGVDMPIGLPDSGPRAADGAARARLGPRRSSVFPTPCRAVLGATDYPDALDRSRGASGKGLSKQSFNLLPKIAEVDAAMTPALQDRIFECHPETAFAHLAGQPLSTTKRQADGRTERHALLRPELGDTVRLATPPPPGCQADDVLDALVVTVIAGRFVAGDVRHLGDGAVDRRGLRMEIVV
jgi:predicted RNase H-like nuclease